MRRINELLKEQLNQDAEDLKVKRNELALVRRGIECAGIQNLRIKGLLLTSESADKVVGWALTHHALHSNLVLSAESILHGLQLLNSNNNESKKVFKDLVFEDEYEKRLLDNVITPSDIGVSFNDIGALEDVKDTLKKLVMLPVQRPELYTKGKLTKPCRGILLFGPPGTGKTMLAKAIATEAGANFINISLSSITSKFNGEEEKFVKAMFSVVRKISPTVIFVDEVSIFSYKCNYIGFIYSLTIGMNYPINYAT
ncbi:outer mitochondrial transmembrane helix translocase-like [Lotus japonicus]|uniref:outer mitochondrial transmembrane helix translocase-like n=1 Tax=Lotus japonicus TaxID=34305 RepID=UPI00258BF307|nr:outer mitochondrial transmembrane helix translocase-like [Lotus japonicus]